MIARTAKDDKDTSQPARGWLARLGPGLVTGASDDDPSGIATYSQVGSRFGFSFLWTMLLSYPLMAAIQEISARIGLVTGRGLAANLRAHFSPALLHVVVLLLLVANVINIGADIGAMAAVLQTLFGGSLVAYVAGFGGVSVALQVFIPYRRYVPYLKWLCVSLLAYVGVVFVVELPWARVLAATIIPTLEWSAASVTAVVAVFGTTISPYLFFWQASEEVEEQRLDPDEAPLKKAPAQADAQLGRMTADTWFGMAVSNLVGFFVMLTAAAVFHAHGVTNIQSTTQAAQALRPVAGRFAYVLFALGIVGTGLLAVPVLAGSSAYAIGEAYRWPVGLQKKPRRAPWFYATIAIATFAGVLLNVARVDPIRALFWSAVVNGVSSAPIMVVIMMLATRRPVMGKFQLPVRLRVLGWGATGMMTAISSAMIVLLCVPLLTHESRSRGSVGAAHEQPVGTAHQKPGILERFENEPARVPLQARELRRFANCQLSPWSFEENASQSLDAVGDSRNGAHPRSFVTASASQIACLLFAQLERLKLGGSPIDQQTNTESMESFSNAWQSGTHSVRAAELVEGRHLVTRRIGRVTGLARVRDLAVVHVRADAILGDRLRFRRQTFGVERGRVPVRVMFFAGTDAFDGAFAGRGIDSTSHD